jgi:hypothetical protein
MFNNRQWSNRRPACCSDAQQQAMVQQASRLLLCRIVLVASRLLLCRIVLLASRLLLERIVLVASRLCSNAQQPAMVQQASRLLQRCSTTGNGPTGVPPVAVSDSPSCIPPVAGTDSPCCIPPMQQCSTTGDGPTGVPPVAAMLNNRQWSNRRPACCSDAQQQAGRLLDLRDALSCRPVDTRFVPWWAEGERDPTLRPHSCCTCSVRTSCPFRPSC